MKTTKYVNSGLNIGLVSWQEAWLLLKPFPLQLLAEYYRGALVFRIPGTSQRIAYKKVRQDLRPARIVIMEEPLPF